MTDQKKRKKLMERYRAATKQMSLNELNGALSSAVYSSSPRGQAYSSEMSSYPKSWYLDDVLIDENKAIVCADGAHYAVAYTIAEDGTVSLATQDTWEKVVQKWVTVS